MKVHKPIGSKERFLEMFQGVTKVRLNEVNTGTMQTGAQLIEKAFSELKNKEANVKQTNSQTSGDANFIEIVTNDREGNEITFTFKVNSQETDQEGVFDIGGASLSQFKIQSDSLNVDMPENMEAVQEFNATHGAEIMDAISEYANFETETASVSDEVYEDAVKLIDKVPYKKGTETIQTNKAYADQKPTNPKLRVDSPQLDKFVSEEDDYTKDVPMEDPLADPPEATAADMAAADAIMNPNADDKTIRGIDPYEQEPEFDDVETSPEEQALFNQAYETLTAAGNEFPTPDQIEAEVLRMKRESGEEPAFEKKRLIPKGAEEFYEGEEPNTGAVLDNETIKSVILAAKEQLEADGSTPSLGDVKVRANQILAAGEIGTEIQNESEEEQKSDYPDQIGKKFKPKNQMPKKKKKPQSVVKVSEEEEIEVDAEVPTDTEITEPIEGGVGDDKSASDFNPQQIMIGMGIEMEHTDDPKVALDIALDHLTEIPDYYTRLDKMEKEADAEAGGEDEVADELLGFKPHNVGDYANEEEQLDSPIPQDADSERNYWNKEYQNQDQADQAGQEADDELDQQELDNEEREANDFEMGGLVEEDGMEEYQGEIGDRYQDGEGNQFTVRNKVNGGVTLQGQGGEKEIATRDIQFLKNLSEAKTEKKNLITEEQVRIARQTIGKRGSGTGMTKEEAVKLLIRHNIK